MAQDYSLITGLPGARWAYVRGTDVGRPSGSVLVIGDVDRKIKSFPVKTVFFELETTHFANNLPLFLI